MPLRWRRRWRSCGGRSARRCSSEAEGRIEIARGGQAPEHLAVLRDGARTHEQLSIEYSRRRRASGAAARSSRKRSSPTWGIGTWRRGTWMPTRSGSSAPTGCGARRRPARRSPHAASAGPGATSIHRPARTWRSACGCDPPPAGSRSTTPPRRSKSARTAGSRRRSLRGSSDWVARLLLRVGDDAEIVEPPELRDQVRDLARETLARYGQTA